MMNDLSLLQDVYHSVLPYPIMEDSNLEFTLNHIARESQLNTSSLLHKLKFDVTECSAISEMEESLTVWSAKRAEFRDRLKELVSNTDSLLSLVI